MTRCFKTTRERNLPRPHRLISLGIVLLMLLGAVSTWLALAHPDKPARAAASFSFTAVSDYGQTSQTTANLNYIAGSGGSFNLGLGDFNYDPNVTPEAWSTYAKSHLPTNFPFEIIAGNHDAAQIDTFAADLSDHIGAISGTYAKEYYFDYPPGAPLARFILLSPGGIAPIVAGYNYSMGRSHYNWVSQQIDGARSAGIPWVIVGMHEPCIYINSTSSSGPCSSLDLLNLLVSKKVDLILYGHERNYQASKQLALNPTTCPTLSTTSYNANCVVNATTNLTKGAGSVMVVTSTGGQPLFRINTTDPKKGYFRTWMGSNINRTWGVSNIMISATQLTTQFVGTSGGTFSDSFTIRV